MLHIKPIYACCIFGISMIYISQETCNLVTEHILSLLRKLGFESTFYWYIYIYIFPSLTIVVCKMEHLGDFLLHCKLVLKKLKLQKAWSIAYLDCYPKKKFIYKFEQES